MDLQVTGLVLCQHPLELLVIARKRGMRWGFLSLPLSLLIPLTPSSPNATAHPPSLFPWHCSLLYGFMVVCHCQDFLVYETDDVSTDSFQK